MDDLISRQAAIEAIADTLKYEDYGFLSDELESVINNVPAADVAERKWIPVSERLPDEDDDVLITDEDGDIDIARYSYNTWTDEPVIEWWDREYRVFPVAWMPLPSPYKGEQE